MATAAETKDDGTEDNILSTHIEFKIPEGTKSGSFFDVKLSDNVNLNGVYKDAEIDPLTYNGVVIADLKIEENRSLRYTFNKVIDNLKDINVSINLPLFIDRKAVPKDSKQTVSVDVTGSDAPTKKEFDVVYDQKDSAKKREGNTISGRADIDQVTDDSYRQTIYYNTNKEDLAVPYVYIGNQPKQDGAKLTHRTNPEDSYSAQVDISDLKVYRLKDGASLNPSYALNEADLEDITDNVSIEPTYRYDNQIKLQFDKTKNKDNIDDSTDKDNSTYVIVYTGKRDSSKNLKTRVDFLAGKKYKPDGSSVRVEEPGQFTPLAWKFDNEIVKVTGNSEVDAELEENGKFQEHHIYITIRDGVMEEPIEKDLDETKGTPDGDPFTTSKKDTAGKVVTTAKDGEGYELIQVIDSDNVGAKEDGSAVNGNYEVGKKKEVTYIYQRVINSVAKTGTFQEHHIYQTKKLDGTIVEDSRDDKEVTEGTEKENYKTSKQDKSGYTLIKVESTNGGQYNEDGSLKEAAYIADTKQEVTYIYQKEEKAQTPIEETGKFQEHHIYITKNEKGEEVDRKVVDGDVTGGTKDMTYTTGKDEKDGFEFVRTENPVEDPSYNEKGETTTGNYKPGVTQEITYVYEKTVKTPTPVEETGKFVEHHIYITKDETGKEISRKSEDGETQEGKKEETYTTGKKEKDGFGFVRTENPVNEPSYKEDGSETTGNYKPGVTQEITYVYEKTVTTPTPVEETGKFVEHHIYITKDETGKEISRKSEDGETQEGKKEETYTTGKKEKDDFEFVRTEKPVNEPTYKEDGSETKGNYKVGVTQEITYVYEKIVKKPVEPSEPEIPWRPLEPSEPVEPDTPWTPLEPSEPVQPGKPEEPEKPVTPEKPGKPEEPEKPVTPEKPNTPEEPEKPTTPEKPQNPQSPGTTNNPAKDEKVVNPNTPTKTMETIKTHGSTKQASKNPKTGLGSSVGIAGIAISSILASIGVEKKKKEDK